jgi:hypothetical protein
MMGFDDDVNSLEDRLKRPRLFAGVQRRRSRKRQADGNPGQRRAEDRYPAWLRAIQHQARLAAVVPAPHPHAADS